LHEKRNSASDGERVPTRASYRGPGGQSEEPIRRPTEQLVTEVVVRDIKRSVAFYRSLGFELLGDAGDFVELTWEDHRLFVAEISAFRGVEPAGLAQPAKFPVANVRVMVPNVDDCWKVASDVGARVVVPGVPAWSMDEVTTGSGWHRWRCPSRPDRTVPLSPEGRSAASHGMRRSGLFAGGLRRAACQREDQFRRNETLM
jgi:catechol 2,3-dioxygenase-like lactoylglutathione lyase family enzyme